MGGRIVSILFVSFLLSVSDAYAFSHRGIADISAGEDNTCVVLADHHINCWGSGNVARDTLPASIPEITSAVQIASGNSFVCTLRTDGSVWCWGTNELGQLGDNSTADRPVHPAPIVSDGAAASQVAVRARHACKRNQNGTASCWGSNKWGESELSPGRFGYEYTSKPNLIGIGAMRTPLLENIVDISAGSFHTCVTLANLTLACWGDNHNYELGSDALSGYIDAWSPFPVTVPDGIGGVTNLVTQDGLSAGGTATCVLTPEPPVGSNAIACWGDNSYGQIGNAVGSKTAVPAAVQFPDGTKLVDILSIATADTFACAILRDHTVACWGDNAFGELGNDAFTGTSSQWPVPVELLGVKIGNIIRLAAGGTHICAIADTARKQEVLCWGNNDQGQLGIGAPDADYHDFPQVIDVDAPIFTDDMEGE